MPEQEQAKFDGWAIVDVLGHQRYVGYVRTEAFGQAVMFRVDVPALPERDYVLQKPQYVGREWTPAGSTVQRLSSPGFTKLIGAGSIYSISPCDEAAALAAIEQTQSAELKVISLADDTNPLVFHPQCFVMSTSAADEDDDPES